MRARITASALATSLACTALMTPAFARAQPAPPSGGDAADSPAGHGSVSIAFFDTAIDGFWLRSDIKLPYGAVHMLGAGLDASYNLSDAWTIYGGIRYFTGRSGGPFPNCPTLDPPQCAGQPPLANPRPAAPFLDDGNYHGAWQDWNLGVAYHTRIGNTYITPSATAFIPTHAYPTFGNAVVGQDLRQLLLDVTLSHQFDFTNFFYQAHYEYFFNTPHIGYGNNYNSFGLDVGYFFSPKLSAKFITDLKIGNGITDQEIGGPPALDPIWLNHDRIRLQDHGLVGGAIDYVFAKNYDLQTTLEHAVWGRSNGDLKYDLDLRVTRSF